jgi:hypothetical protein
MSTDTVLQLALRFLPALTVLILAFIAASDAKTRAQWTNLLYQAGSIRPDQRDNPKIQGGVKLPFFIVAVLMLIWPVQYYFHATRTITVTEGSDIRKTSKPSLGSRTLAPQGTNATVGTQPGMLTAPGTTPQMVAPTPVPTGPHL